MSTSSPALSVRQLAEHWQVSERHVYDLITQRKLGHLRIGSAIRIRREDVEAYETAAFQTPTSQSCSPRLPDRAPLVVTPRRDAFQIGRALRRKFDGG